MKIIKNYSVTLSTKYPLNKSWKKYVRTNKSLSDQAILSPRAHQILDRGRKCLSRLTPCSCQLLIYWTLSIAHARSIFRYVMHVHESARAARESRMLIICPPLASRKNDSCAVDALFTLFGYRFIRRRSLEFIEQDAVRNKWKLCSAVRRSFARTKNAGPRVVQFTKQSRELVVRSSSGVQQKRFTVN